MSTLEVYVRDRRVGTLREDIATGLIDFEYLPDTPPEYAASLTMPVGVAREEYLGFNGLPPPFEVSLPEGAVLDAIRIRFGKHIDVDDDLALLRLVGRHTVGCVTFGGPLETDASLEKEILRAARSDEAARRLTGILGKSPQMSGMAGVMPKMSASRASRRPGTLVGQGVIVKFDSPNFRGASLVEYACLKACAAAGLDVPRIALSPDYTSITIDRFDLDDKGCRRGFEDACALSGIRRSGKYRGSVEQVFGMIGNFVHPEHQEEDRHALLRLMIMNDVLRNGDAHLKNFGLLYGEDLARPRLSPVYDVLTTQVWIPRDSPALPLSTGKGMPQSPRWLEEQDLEPLREIAGVDNVNLKDLYAFCADTAIGSLNETFGQCRPCAERDALNRAIKCVEKAWAQWEERMGDEVERDPSAFG